MCKKQLWIHYSQLTDAKCDIIEQNLPNAMSKVVMKYPSYKQVGDSSTAKTMGASTQASREYDMSTEVVRLSVPIFCRPEIFCCWELVYNYIVWLTARPIIRL